MKTKKPDGRLLINSTDQDMEKVLHTVSGKVNISVIMADKIHRQRLEKIHGKASGLKFYQHV